MVSRRRGNPRWSNSGALTGPAHGKGRRERRTSNSNSGATNWRSIVSMKRRSFIGIGLSGLAAVVFPEFASAGMHPPAAESSDGEAPWQWQPREARAAAEEERARYLRFLEDDLNRMERSYGARAEGAPLPMSVAASMSGTVVALSASLATSRIYARHVQLASDDTVLRTATTTFTVSEDGRNMNLDSMGVDARSAMTSRAKFDARVAATAKACPPGKHSCRTCSELNTAAVLTCCGGCAWAGGNPIALLSCAIIMCSLCASQNCRRWTYACCGV